MNASSPPAPDPTTAVSAASLAVLATAALEVTAHLRQRRRLLLSSSCPSPSSSCEGHTSAGAVDVRTAAVAATAAASVVALALGAPRRVITTAAATAGAAGLGRLGAFFTVLACATIWQLWSLCWRMPALYAGWRLDRPGVPPTHLFCTIMGHALRVGLPGFLLRAERLFAAAAAVVVALCAPTCYASTLVVCGAAVVDVCRTVWTPLSNAWSTTAADRAAAAALVEAGADPTAPPLPSNHPLCKAVAGAVATHCGKHVELDVYAGIARAKTTACWTFAEAVSRGRNDRRGTGKASGWRGAVVVEAGAVADAARWRSTLAVVMHEVGHLHLSHPRDTDRMRIGVAVFRACATVVVGLGVVLPVLLRGTTPPPAAAAARVVAFPLARALLIGPGLDPLLRWWLQRQSRRHELEADAFSAAAGFGEALAEVLVHEGVHHRDTDWLYEQLYLTHPGAGRRLAALRSAGQKLR